MCNSLKLSDWDFLQDYLAMWCVYFIKLTKSENTKIS